VICDRDTWVSLDALVLLELIEVDESLENCDAGTVVIFTGGEVCLAELLQVTGVEVAVVVEVEIGLIFLDDLELLLLLPPPLLLPLPPAPVLVAVGVDGDSGVRDTLAWGRGETTGELVVETLSDSVSDSGKAGLGVALVTKGLSPVLILLLVSCQASNKHVRTHVHQQLQLQQLQKVNARDLGDRCGDGGSCEMRLVAATLSSVGSRAAAAAA
jgi:hypothetical protein